MVEDDVVDQLNDFEYMDEANFVIRLNKGTELYKGKLPLKCYNCARIGHFASKSSFRESIDNNKERIF